MTNYHVACSPLSNRIYAGRVDKRGQTWAKYGMLVALIAFLIGGIT